MRCSKCGAEFEGNFCPNCGFPAQPNPVHPQTYVSQYAYNKKPRKKLSPAQIVVVVLGSAALFFILISAVNSIISDSPNANSTVTSGAATNSKRSTSSVSDVIKIDYKALYKDYTDNPINADSKYKDKKLQLTGKIANIDRDIGKNPYITFNVDEYGAQSIKMSFEDDKIVAALKKGQNVTVVGTCSGTFASTVVVINNCSIAE